MDRNRFQIRIGRRARIIGNKRAAGDHIDDSGDTEPIEALWLT